MTIHSLIKPALGALAALGLGLTIPATAAHAQSDYGYGSDSADITVYGPQHTERDPTTGAPYEFVRTSRIVPYGDLDLSTGWGVQELRARVFRAARDACSELAMTNDVVSQDNRSCIRQAADRAMAEAPISAGSGSGYTD